MGVPQLAREVGLWWPAADEDGLRRAAAAWDGAAAALDHAGALGRAGAAASAGAWTGEAADRFERSWRDHDATLRDDAGGCRALAAALRAYADAVADAKRRVEELAVTAGATVVAGAGLAWLTFGASAGVAAGVAAGLVAAAEAVGVELSATAATIAGGAVAGAGFGAAEAAVVDMAVTQPLRVRMFHDGGWSVPEAVGSAATGGVLGGAIGGALGAAGRPLPTLGGPADLREVDGMITAALTPAHPGALGPLFRSGIHDTPALRFVRDQRPLTHLLADEGRSVHARPSVGLRPGALVRSGPTDVGRITELAHPEAPTVAAVENEILEAGGRLGRQGTGDLVLDGRAVGLDVDTAGEGLAAAVERAGAQGLVLPASIRFVFDTMSVHWP